MFAAQPEAICVYDTDLPLTLGHRKTARAGTFASVVELEQALEQCGLDVSQWGKRVEGSLTKTVLDLWEELERGECDLHLDRGGVRRQLNVVKVRVRPPKARGGDELIETWQIFSDGRRRSRGMPLSEKMFPGEAPLDAAERGIVEELGSAIVEARAEGEGMPEWPIEINCEAPVEPWVETRYSSSYPFLASQYSLYQVEAVVHGLPSTAFSTVEIGEGCTYSGGQLAHFWEWKGADAPDGGAATRATDAATLAQESGACVMYVSADGTSVLFSGGCKQALDM